MDISAERKMEVIKEVMLSSLSGAPFGSDRHTYEPASYVPVLIFWAIVVAILFIIIAFGCYIRRRRPSSPVPAMAPEAEADSSPVPVMAPEAEAGSGIIACLPVLDYTAIQKGGDDCCSICLSDFIDDRAAIQLPCSHFYHSGCITAWFRHHTTCPVCRASLAVSMV